MPQSSQFQRPIQGWILYDGHCGFCSRWVNFWRPTLARHGFKIAALEEAWVVEKLKMPYEELVVDIRLLTASGELVSGADVYLYVAHRIWWAWPFDAIFTLPGFHRLLHAAYRSFARNRYHLSCRLHP
jgi:predicted DCC family thiol-disulfide oxidoreductase YuxK